MKKNLFLLFLLFSCGTPSIQSNEVLISEIDELPNSECYYILGTDSLGNVIDTIDFVQLKLDENDEKIFKKRNYQHNDQNYTSIEYYWNDKLSFLEKSYSESGDFQSYSEVFKDNKDRMKKLVGFSEFDGERDSLILDYTYELTFLGKVKKLTITGRNNYENSITEFLYNNKEQVTSEVIIIEKDTIDKKNYFYSDSKIIEKKHIKYFGDTIIFNTIYEYDLNGFQIWNKKYKTENKEKILVKEFIYQNDEKGKTESYVEIDHINNKKVRGIKKNINCE